MTRPLSSILFCALLAAAVSGCDDDDSGGPGPGDAGADAQGDAAGDAAGDTAGDAGQDALQEAGADAGEDAIGDGVDDLVAEDADSGTDLAGEDVSPDAELDALQEDTATGDTGEDAAEDTAGDAADTAGDVTDSGTETGDVADTSGDGEVGGDVGEDPEAEVEVGPFCGDGTVDDDEECDPGEPVTSCFEPDTCVECACQPDLAEGCPDATAVWNLLEFAVEGGGNVWRHAGTGDAAPTLPGTSGVAGGLFAPPEGCSVPTGGVGAEEAVYTFVPHTSGVYRFTTDVSGADSIDDTILYVLESCVPSEGGEVGCSEDIASDNFRSELWVRLVEGQTYFVIVDGFTADDNGGPYALEAALVTLIDVGAPCTVADPLEICDETSNQFCTDDGEGRLTCVQYGERPVLTEVVVAEEGPLEGMSGIELDFVDEGGVDPVCSVDGGTFDVVTWTIRGTSGDPLSVVVFVAELFGTVPFVAPPDSRDESGNILFDFSLCFPPGLVPFDPDPVSFAVFDDLAPRGVIGTWFTSFAALSSDAGVVGGRLSNFIELVMTEPDCGDALVTPGEPCDQSATPNGCSGAAEVCESCDFCTTP